ncbi:class I SAM-dependent methyltransferase [Pseudomonas putida]|uniref:class I SAM-dependent methyltransferase n=1 Tax=Pseudomonas putida TaxID=303 RepID=UPI000645A306|nr:class I SAM-dependent methyltransferase [Pseudomonas putida]
MDTGLLRAIYREITLRQPFVRTPEPDLVMVDETCVSAYADSAGQGQALSGTYLYHCAQMCALIKPGDVVLDIGCGPASLLLQLARLNPRAEFIGADLSASMLEVGRESIRQQGIDNVELREEDMTRLAGIADRSVDVVISSMALHHLADLSQLEATFRNIARVLRNDRAIYLNDFGRLKSVESVDYFVSRASDGADQATLLDYRNSLLAAFSREEFQTLAASYLGPCVKVYSTAISPLMMVVRTPKRRCVAAMKDEFRRRYRCLPRSRQADVDQLRLFLGMGGMASAF